MDIKLFEQKFFTELILLIAKKRHTKTIGRETAQCILGDGTVRKLSQVVALCRARQISPGVLPLFFRFSLILMLLATTSRCLHAFLVVFLESDNYCQKYRRRDRPF